MKKVGGVLLSFILVFSIISFNASFVTAADVWWWDKANGEEVSGTQQQFELSGALKKYNSRKELLQAMGKVASPSAKLPSTTTGRPAHGVFGKGYEYFFGAGSTLAKGTKYTVDAATDKVTVYSKDATNIPADALTADGIGYSTAGIIQGFSHAIGIFTAIQTIGGIFLNNKNLVQALSYSIPGGVATGEGVYYLFGKGGVWYDENNWISQNSKMASIGSGAIVAAIIFYNMYRVTSTEVVEFECNSWDAPSGGENCELCNKQGELPCSEYQCRSLGQSCQLLNSGTEEEMCAWVGRSDVSPPVITPWIDALTTGYVYYPDNAIAPPDNGVKIVKQGTKDGCLEAFTPLSFGIYLDEPGKCKIDSIRRDTYDEMSFFFGGSQTLKYNHTQGTSVPGLSKLGTDNSDASSQNIVIENDGEYAIYTRCKDANGNYNTANFVFKFCVEEGPDTTPPVIVATNLKNNMPIAYNQTKIDFELYTNEYADCKWSRRDQSYEEMENELDCSINSIELNSQIVYECSTVLDSLRNNVENKFYFKCKDNPNAAEGDRNVNSESYEFTLIGTIPLVISEVGPNETIKDSTDPVKVTLTAETSAGYKEGESACYYSETDNDNDYVKFFNTDSYTHSQDLYLEEGNYEYYIKCIDLGGNFEVNKTEFTVDTDTSSPMIVRVYNEENYLKLITDEEAECVYDTTSCNYLFDDGIGISSVDDKEHYTDWDVKSTFYVKCQDEFGNQPNPNECSIIVRPIEV